MLPSVAPMHPAMHVLECVGCLLGCLHLLHAEGVQTQRTDPQATKVRREQKNAEKKKEKNRIIHSKPGTVKIKAARKKKLIAELE